MIDYDVLVIADPRFPGGTSTGLAAELAAHGRSGYSSALIALKGSVLKYPHPYHPAIRSLIDQGLVDLVDPAGRYHARIAIFHHPMIFSRLPARPLRFKADIALLIVHHPPLNGRGEANYDVAAIDGNLALMAGQPVIWAPLSPIVRKQLESLAQPPRLLPFDWHNVVDTAAWQVPRTQKLDWPIRIGRHSRPDRLKWPADRDAILQAYPDDPDFSVAVLGSGAYLEELMEHRLPANWRVQPFDPFGAATFLATIDFFVYYHHPDWIEAFGRTILEALASGCIAVLPPSFQTLFGDAAVYVPAHIAPIKVRMLHADPSAVAMQRQTTAAVLEDRFSFTSHVRRLASLIGPSLPDHGRVPIEASRSRRRVLFFTSNGVGMGHLIRALALARRLPSSIEPIIVTLSQAVKVPLDLGFHVEYIPFHSYVGADNHAWNRFLREELALLLAYYDPAVFVFDGNTPYAGLLAALKHHSSCWAVWCRRGMWRPASGAVAMSREPGFDAVLEPGELARAFDQGPTIVSVDRTRQVEPVRLLDESEFLPRAAARAALDLSPDGDAVLVQLGAGNNFDYATIQRRVVDHLARRPSTQIVVMVSPISMTMPVVPPGVRVVSKFPAARYFAAFDAAVSAAGYNSFHELMLAGIPTLFVPNENPSMDDQLGRANWAAHGGFALTIRTRAHFQIAEQLDELMNAQIRREIKGRLAILPPANGAVAAAQIVAEMAFTLRADRLLG